MLLLKTLSMQKGFSQLGVIEGYPKNNSKNDERVKCNVIESEKSD